MQAAEIAAATSGRLVGPDVAIDGASIDSRELAPGSLFVPIVDVRDGHDFVVTAVEHGAAAFLTSRPVEGWFGSGPDPALPAGVAAIEVHDTVEALAALGRHARSRLGSSPELRAVVGITGSVGKTTTKDLLAGVLATTYRTAASLRSFNNELGVPLTLVNAPGGTEAAVVEMGARGRGHIALLCGIARPTIGVVTAVEMVHTQLFGDLSEVAAAKAELIESLPPDGAAVLDADNELVAAMGVGSAARVLRFSARSGPGPDARGVELWVSAVGLDDQLRPSFAMHTPWGDIDVRLEVRGRHNVSNALAAAGAALLAGVPLERVAQGLGHAGLSPWRMDLRTGSSGARVLNDAYNAGPASTAAALQALVALGAGRSTAVLGVMAELGADGPAAHRAIAEQAAALGVRVIAVAAPDYGPTVEHVDDRDGALDRLRAGAGLGPDDAVLVKGSRVAGLEVLAQALLAGP
jgi:UDP-N-acetylmuramoyl-tripeptide--D-alanyl-D-alanine ligase